MKYFLLIVFAISGGIIGGMGMGGGTLLIPLLTIFAGVEQHAAQAINLISFLPMAVVSLIIHTKNKLVEYKKILPVVIPAMVTSFISSAWAMSTAAKMLRTLFGWFLLALGIYQAISVIMSCVNAAKAKQPLQPEL